MNLINALVAIALLMDFLVGVALGVFVTVCAACLREDRQRTLRHTPLDLMSAGTRVLAGVGLRKARLRRPPGYPGQQPRQGWGPD
jgi:hypothetical protein